MDTAMEVQINLTKDDSMVEPGSLDTAGPPAAERLRKLEQGKEAAGFTL
jgi:hypothetical protein